MKKFNLSLVAVLAMSTFAIAGGDIAPVEPVVEVPVIIEEDNSAFYLGLGYGLVNYQIDRELGANVDEDVNTVMFQAGYEFNSYVAVEGRYWYGFDDIGDIAGDYSTWGIYVKPQYPIGAFSIYALLGYASTSAEPDHNIVDYVDTDSFSWGLGAQYAFTENLSVFVDYVDLGETDDFVYNEEHFRDHRVDVSIDSINFGLTYKF